MDGKRGWLGWIAIGLSALAVLVALFGSGFGPRMAAAGMSGADAPQSYAQPGSGARSGQVAPGTNAQPGPGAPNAAPQRGQVAPGTNAQPGPGAPNAAPQSGRAAPAMGPRPGAGRPGRDRSGGGGWFGGAFRAIGRLFQLGALALLVVLGVWLMRGRGARAKPAQAPGGESSGDERSDRE